MQHRPQDQPGPDLSFLDPRDGPADGAAALAAVLHDGRRRRRRRRRALELVSTAVAAGAVLLALVGIDASTGGVGPEPGPPCAVGTPCPPALGAAAPRGPAGTLLLDADDGSGAPVTFWVTADPATRTREQTEFLGRDGLLVTAAVAPGGRLAQLLPVGDYQVGRWQDGAEVGGRVAVAVGAGATAELGADDLPR